MLTPGSDPTGVQFTPDDLRLIVDMTLGSDIDALPSPDQVPAPILAMLDRFGLTLDWPFRSRRLEAARLRAHGVRLVSGTDAGVGAVKEHGNLWRAVTDLVTVGYPVDEALSTATSLAAEACGLGGVTGRLAPGLEADLLVVDGDVRAEPEALGRPLAVFLRGQPPG